MAIRIDRPAEEVLKDVLGGFVSREAAARHYGVAIRGGAIDHDDDRRAARQPARRSKAFHRNEYVDALS